jgi:hypothetical protein
MFSPQQNWTTSGQKRLEVGGRRMGEAAQTMYTRINKCEKN